MSTSTSSTSGSTTTAADEAWMRPCAPAGGTSRTRGAPAAPFGDDLLEATHGAFTHRHHLDLPALQGGKALIHPEQVAGKKRGLVAAGAGADFQHDVAIVHRVLGQQRDADLLRQLDAAG